MEQQLSSIPASQAGVPLPMPLPNPSLAGAAGALKNLQRMGFDPACFCGVVTSGEVTHRQLVSRPDAWWGGLGRRCLHFTWGSRGAICLEGLDLEVTTDPQQVGRQAEPA
jgi:hypothetical protein